jgi:secretion/DNA translocation related TadE-like protein
MKRGSWRREERGSITVVAVAVMALIVVMTMGAADVGVALIARAHAQQGADAAALAAAQELALPTGRAPVAFAADFAALNHARLVACVCGPGTTQAVTTVAVEVPHWLLFTGTHTVTARARAVVDAP